MKWGCCSIHLSVHKRTKPRFCAARGGAAQRRQAVAAQRSGGDYLPVWADAARLCASSDRFRRALATLTRLCKQQASPSALLSRPVATRPA